MLRQAIVGGNLEDVKKLVLQGHKVNQSQGIQPLYFAAREGHFEIVKFLIEACGANIHAKTKEGKQPIHVASKYGYLNIVRYLVEQAKADLNAVNNNGHTPLMLAKGTKRTHVVEYLTNFIMNQQFQQMSLAIQVGDLPRIRCIVEEQHYNIEERDEISGAQAIHIAASCGFMNVLQYLVEQRRANLSSKDKLGRTPLDLAKAANKNQAFAYLKNCLEKQQQMAKDLHEALEKNDSKKAITIMKDGYKLHENAADALQFLRFAVRRGYLEIVKYLISQCNVDVLTADTNGQQLIHSAAASGHPSIVKHLIEQCNVDPHTKARDGSEPLHLAARNGHMNVIKYLMQKCNADPDAKNNDGKSVMDIAREFNTKQSSIEEYLRTLDRNAAAANTSSSNTSSSNTSFSTNTSSSPSSSSSSSPPAAASASAASSLPKRQRTQ